MNTYPMKWAAPETSLPAYVFLPERHDGCHGEHGGEAELQRCGHQGVDRDRVFVGHQPTAFGNGHVSTMGGYRGHDTRRPCHPLVR